MTANDARAAILDAALRAGLNGQTSLLDDLVTADIRVWTPRFAASSRQELIDELAMRDAAFTDLDLTTRPLDVGGDFACIEWTVSMTHVAPIVLGDDTTIPTTGARVAVHGVTVAEFDGSRICAIRQYWDESTLFAELAGASPPIG